MTKLIYAERFQTHTHTHKVNLKILDFIISVKLQFTTQIKIKNNLITKSSLFLYAKEFYGLACTTNF